MEPYVGTKCNYCGKVLTENDEVIICPKCFRPHHIECWMEKQGCSTEGCSEQSAEEKEKLRLRKEQERQQREAALAEERKREEGAVAPASAAREDKKTLLIFAAIAVVVLIVILTRNKSVNFGKLYEEYCKSTWATLGADGSYLSIDTNPYDRDDAGLAYPAAYEAIKKVNNALGLPDSLIEEMGSTTALHGRQSESFDKKGVTVSWSYHPDKGLEVTYKKSK